MTKTRAKTVFICQQCGAESLKWVGRCPECGEWNTMVETVVERREPSPLLSLRPESTPQPLSEVTAESFQRIELPLPEFSRVLGGGVVPGSLVLIGGDPGIGKCVTADTRLLDPASGAYLPITEWATAKREVLAVDEQTLRLAPAFVSAFHERGTQPIVEVKTALGRTLRCTPGHPVLTPEGWRSVGELTAGSRIATPRALPYFGRDSLPEAAIKLIAYALSDGSAQSKTPIARFLEEVGLRFITAADKAVPDCIFRLPREQLALFLKVLFTCDGSVYVNRRGQPGVSYSTISPRLAEDVQHLLLRFGLVATLRTKRSCVNSAPYTAYEVVLLGVPDIQHFLATIGIMGRKAFCEQIAEMEPPQLPSTQRDTIPTSESFWERLRTASGNASFAEISRRAGVTIRNRRRERPLCRPTVASLADSFPDPCLYALAHGDVYWDEIASITPAGEATVYDLSVPGKANFVANDLIIHNSTLLLQVAALMARGGAPVLYVSGEESVQQIKMRAQRLGIASDGLYLLAETNLNAILEHVHQLSPKAMVIDSIQAVYLDELTSTAGSVSQVRECTSRLMYLAKGNDIPVFIVGHVTKAGAIAGPKVLEHIVDTVLYLEGERFHSYRLLRSVKNRFGSTNEVGVFEMGSQGLMEVPNPSEAFLAERLPSTAGSTIAVTLEGTRPLLVEIQALTSPTSFGYPRRTANGIDFNRLLLLVAVLTQRVGLKLFNQDVFVNVVGGLKINEPAADLSVAVAIASSFRNAPVGPDLAIIGEIGLSGELRTISQVQKRLSEAAKLGFKRCLLPRSLRRAQLASEGMELIGVRSLGEALEVALEK